MELQFVNNSYFKQLFQNLRPKLQYSKIRIFVTSHFFTLLCHIQWYFQVTCYLIVINILQKSTYTRLIWGKQTKPLVLKSPVPTRLNSGWTFKLCKLNIMDNIQPFMKTQLVDSIIRRTNITFYFTTCHIIWFRLRPFQTTCI